MEDLTPRQQQVLAFITKQVKEQGYPPTLREIALHIGISGNAGVMSHLEALEKKGYIRRHEGSSRGITLTAPVSRGVEYPITQERIIMGDEEQFSERLPVVGTVRAGSPEIPFEDIEDYFAIDRSQLRSGGRFFLRVRGDSMINACIQEGDLALVRPQSTAQNRDIVVALVNGEATLKRFYRERDNIRLQPENPNLNPIVVRPGEGEVAIVGKVVGIYRQLT
ncbi:MAG: transcriptional repressor LexA [Geobacter sp.]|nr:transcriptional repressor LexA [Geobacter sp.]